MFEAYLNAVVVADGRRDGREIALVVHDIGHDRDVFALAVFYGNGGFLVEMGVALIDVEGSFTSVGDLPKQAVYLTVLPGADGCNTTAGAVAPEEEFVVREYHRLHHRGVRTAPFHLVQIDIATVGEVVFVGHIIPP